MKVTYGALDDDVTVTEATTCIAGGADNGGSSGNSGNKNSGNGGGAA